MIRCIQVIYRQLDEFGRVFRVGRGVEMSGQRADHKGEGREEGLALNLLTKNLKNDILTNLDLSFHYEEQGHSCLKISH